MIRVLLIEDDLAIAQAVALALPKAEYKLDVEESGRTGLDQAMSHEYDLVVTDINLPEVGGFDICRLLRDQKPLLPVLVLTARGEEIDVVLGLEQGADDYLVKPFRGREFLSRIRALLRRSDTQQRAAPQAVEQFQREMLSVDAAERTVSVDGAPVELTNLEFELLLFLISKEGTAVSRDSILSEVWQYDNGCYDTTMNSQISRLRKKLGRAGGYIQTVRGFGYRLSAHSGRKNEN